MRGDGAAEENLALVLAVDHGTERIGHAPLRDHAPGQIGGALEVVGGAGGHLLHEDFLGDAPAEEHRDHLQQALLVLAVAVAFR